MSRRKPSRRVPWLRPALAVAALAGFAAAYRFALRYRERVGLPRRSPVETTPGQFSLDFEEVAIPAGDHDLAAWFVPAGPERPKPRRRRGRPAAAATGSAEAASAASHAATPSNPAPASGPASERRPAIAIVHGWESNRGRTLAHVRYLHAAGFHCLALDVRGHGDNPPETLPINVPEFADDTAAAARWLAARPDVSAVGVLGHSMGGAGAIVAAAREPSIEAVVSLSSPSDLVRMTRQTFRMAEMNVPEAIATPLAWFTAAVLLAPRRRSVESASALAAAGRYRGPLLLVHGAQDHGVPVRHLELIARAALTHRGPDDGPVETLVLPEFGHRWLYEDANCRRRTAAFFARWLGGPVAPDTAGERAAECVVERPPDPIYGFGALTSRAPQLERRPEPD
ncbi:MAG: alpha/beta fold hydrolase [Candidatus Limnocylindrales bacterium]|jgi:alpha-beta hydrolase superfamily lysophospholipase